MRNLVWLVLVIGSVGAPAAAYDPLAVPDGQDGESRDLDVIDGERDRTIPIRLFLPRDGRRSS